jgi:hypothetical protein
MKRITFALLAATVLFAGSKGIAPRSSPQKYAASATADGHALGAQLLTPGQVHKAFSTDLSRYLVVEVAFFPEKDRAAEIAHQDFTLRRAGTDDAAKPQSARLAAATVQTSAAKDRNLDVSPSVGVGYETAGYDPMTGRRREGGWRVSTGAAVGVGEPSPGSTVRDREVMELELTEKGLPEGRFTAPVAGYLYFQLPQGKSKKKTAYELEYQGVVLRLEQ